MCLSNMCRWLHGGAGHSHGGLAAFWVYRQKPGRGGDVDSLSCDAPAGGTGMQRCPSRGGIRWSPFCSLAVVRCRYAAQSLQPVTFYTRTNIRCGFCHAFCIAQSRCTRALTHPDFGTRHALMHDPCVGATCLADKMACAPQSGWVDQDELG